MKRMIISFLMLSILNTLEAQDFTWSHVLESSKPIEIEGQSTDIQSNTHYLLLSFEDYIDVNGLRLLSNGGKDFCLISYSDEGGIIWFNNFGSSGNDFGYELRALEDGQILVAGAFQDTLIINQDSIFSTGNFDGFLASFNSNGSINWLSNIVKGEANSFQVISSVCLDQFGDIVFSGFFRSEAYFTSDSLYARNSTDILFGKITQDGQLRWVQNIGCTSNSSRIVQAVTTGSGYYFAGNFIDSIFISGSAYTSQNSNTDNFIFKTNYNGVVEWVRTTSGSGIDLIRGACRDNNNNLYITGDTESFDFTIDSTQFVLSEKLFLYKGGRDTYTAKYSIDGQLQWINYVGELANDLSYGVHIKDSYLYQTGSFSDILILGEDTLRTNGTIDEAVLVSQYDLDGNYIWSHSANGIISNEDERGRFVTINANNEILLSGEYASPTLILNDSTYNKEILGVKSAFFSKITCLPIGIDTETASDVLCYNDSTGSIIIEGSGGFTDLIYSIDNGQSFQSSSDFIKLPAGDYRVIVRDSAGCETLSSILMVDQPDSLYIFSIDSVDVTTNGGDDGSIFVTGSGGTTPYNWTLNQGPPIQTGDFTGLTAGKYQVALVDANDCGPVLSDSITIREPGVGLADFNAGKIFLYPNPVHSSLTLSLNDSEAGEILILITDASGKSVLSKNFTSAGGEFTRNIEVSDLDRGLYFVQIAGGETLGSFVKE